MLYRITANDIKQSKIRITQLSFLRQQKRKIPTWHQYCEKNKHLQNRLYVFCRCLLSFQIVLGAWGGKTNRLRTFIQALWWTDTRRIKTPKEKVMYRQKGEAVKFLFPAGQGGYEVVWKGAKSDTTTSKQALGVIRARNDMDSLGKQRQCYPGPDTQTFRHTAHTIIFSLYIAIMKNWHMSNPISFSFLLSFHTQNHPHTLRNAQWSADIKFSTHPHHASVRNHITSATPISSKHNVAATSTLSNLWAHHYVISQCSVMPAKANNKKKRSTHPSRERIGHGFRYFFSSGTVMS